MSSYVALSVYTVGHDVYKDNTKSQPDDPTAIKGRTNMTVDDAKLAGWTITNTGDQWCAEKGIFMHIGPLKMVLQMVEKFTDKKGDK